MTWMPFSTAALRSMWSEPTPAVMHIFKFLACDYYISGGRKHRLDKEARSIIAILMRTFEIRSRVRYPGWKGVVMRTSACARESAIILCLARNSGAA